MTHMTITREDGTTTIENILSCVDSASTDSHEFLAWDNGDLTIEGWEYQVTDSDKPDHVRLDLAGVRKLRDFLTGQRITELLETIGKE